MMCVTRVIAFVIGRAVRVLRQLHVQISLLLRTQRHFEITAVIVVPSAVVLTVLMALWETRELRRVLVAACREGKPVDLALGRGAGRQAVLFPGRHALHEAIVDPFITIAAAVRDPALGRQRAGDGDGPDRPSPASWGWRP